MTLDDLKAKAAPKATIADIHGLIDAGLIYEPVLNRYRLVSDPKGG